ncbi:MAG: tRNA-dihydrouridine synthase 3 [Sarea resinae]|nr:MAG: tRNA-dihydrouridine synthase 3 [Sarea resinae]
MAQDADIATIDDAPVNPLDPTSPLKRPQPGTLPEDAHAPQPPLPEDSAVTNAEKVERTGLIDNQPLVDDFQESPAKKIKLNGDADQAAKPVIDPRQKGVAPIKKEFLIFPLGSKKPDNLLVTDDDAAEAAGRNDEDRSGGKRKGKSKGQNTGRQFGSSRDKLELCSSRAKYPEFSPLECRFGDGCKFEHDLRKYLQEGKRDDLKTFNGLCPVWEANGVCYSGWKCRFVGSHMKERVADDGRKELVLTENTELKTKLGRNPDSEEGAGVVNVVSMQSKVDLARRKTKTPKADKYIAWLDNTAKEPSKQGGPEKESTEKTEKTDGITDNAEEKENGLVADNRAQYREPPFLASEKRRLYFGPDTPVLAPLTTQGNLPFRRLCVSLGAQLTYSEMAMSMPIVQGVKSEWALMKAHESEISPPVLRGQNQTVTDYDNSKDLKFGVQITANKAWQAVKAAEVMTALCPHIRLIDLNCGCPIDLVVRTGAGAALLDNASKLEKIVRGVNVVSGDVPATIKIRMGTKDSKPTAQKLIERMLHGQSEGTGYAEGAAGVAAITLHGRSRQQRYTKSADWGYIAECSALINWHNQQRNELADTVREADPRTEPASSGGRVYFIGNGDCYSHEDYNTHIQDAKVDSVMIARGALTKPWIFEEIEKGQYLDKSASERLGLVEKFAKYGLEAWGSDEIGVGITRRFLLEWLSFAYRYIPVGILEHLPPSLQDRPPAWRGRNDLETLLGSDNYKDWIKISEMFLGPAHKDFKFDPKHTSNSYDIEAEG